MRPRGGFDAAVEQRLRVVQALRLRMRLPAVPADAFGCMSAGVYGGGTPVSRSRQSGLDLWGRFGLMPRIQLPLRRSFHYNETVKKVHHLKVAEFVVPLKVRKLKEGGYVATSPVLRGLVAEGRSLAETMEIAQDVARKLIESYLDHGDPLPAALQRLIRRGTSAPLHVPVAVHV